MWYTIFTKYYWGLNMSLPSGFRTYLPKLLLIGRLLCGYIRRHQDKLSTNLGENGPAVIDAVLVACDALEVAILVVLPEND